MSPNTPGDDEVELYVRKLEIHIVINVNFVSGFVGNGTAIGYAETTKAPEDEMMDPFDFLIKKGSGVGPPISRLMDHFDLAIRLAGPANVGIGSDYDGASHFPVGLDDISFMPLVTETLLERGHSEDYLAKMLV